MVKMSSKISPLCTTEGCIFNDWTTEDEKCIIHRFEFSTVYVPRDTGTFGHMLIVSKKHIKDITELDASLSEENRLTAQNLLIEMNVICKRMKGLLSRDGMKVSRVYVATLNETGGDNSHLHFHLIPRYDGDKTGFEFLYSNELEEAKWKLDYEDNDFTPYKRLRNMLGKIEGELLLLENDKWRRFDSKVQRSQKRLELANMIQQLLENNRT